MLQFRTRTHALARSITAALAGLALFAAAPAVAQVKADVQGKQVDAAVRKRMEALKIPGVAVAVIRDGKISVARGYGLANVELNVPVTPQTVFQSGSIGKQFAAALAMLLVEDGKIDLDAPVSTYLQEAPPAWKAMTVRHLLSHTAGVSDGGCLRSIDPRRDYSEKALLDIIVAMPLDFQPGEKWRYSNCGYATLGILLGRVGGSFYGDQLQARIFKPLGMTTAHIISEADIVPNRAAGYRMSSGVLKNQTWVSPSMNTTADGSLHFTVLDLAKWDAALYSERLLKRSSLEAMWTPARLNNGEATEYGFGWFLGERNGVAFERHGGSWQGFKTDIARFPARKLTVVVLANRAGVGLVPLSDALVALYEPDLKPPPKPAAAKE